MLKLPKFIWPTLLTTSAVLQGCGSVHINVNNGSGSEHILNGKPVETLLQECKAGSTAARDEFLSAAEGMRQGAEGMREGRDSMKKAAQEAPFLGGMNAGAEGMEQGAKTMERQAESYQKMAKDCFPK